MNPQIIPLNAREADRLSRWIKSGTGALVFDNVIFESVEGGGIWIRPVKRS